jgi:glutathione transport system substrate-binding protein
MTTKFALTRADFLKLGLGAIGAAAIGPHGASAAGSQLTIMQTEAPRSMDPADHTASYTAAVLGTMYEGLTQYDESLTLRPALATAWTVNDAQTEFTFTLRPGVTFHDNTPFDAASVVASFERHLDVKRGLASSGRFRAVIASVAADGPMTVRFTLKTPYPAFLRLVAINNACIVSPTADKTGTLGRQAVGTGPFRFVEWRSGDYVQQARNPAYWGDKPSFETMRWTWSSEAAVMNMALQTGDADVVNPLPPLFAGPLKNRSDATLLEGSSAAVFWVSLNTRLKPLDDVRVRQALNYATNREALVRSLLYGYATPANSPLAPVTFGYDATLPGYKFDIARARALLTEAGYPSGISISIAVQEAQANLAQALQGMWAEAGIKLDVRRMEGGVWTQAAFAKPEQKAEAGTNTVLASWAAGTFDADLQLRPLYATASAPPGGANLGFYSNPKLDALIDQAGQSGSPDERKKLYAEAQKIIQDDAPHVLLYYPKDLCGVASSVKGLWVLPGGQVMPRAAKRV